MSRTTLQLLDSDDFVDQKWNDDTILELLIQFLDQQAATDTTILDNLERFLKVSAGLMCEKCGGQMDTCCSSGNPRCEVCEGPCPGCSDGDGYGADTDDDDNDTNQIGD